MTEVAVTNEQVLNFRRNKEKYTSFHSAQFRPFLYALNKMYQKTKHIEDEILEKERELNINYAARDKEGYAIKEKHLVKTKSLNGDTREVEEEGNFKYNPEQFLALAKAKRELLNIKVVITPHHTDDIPNDFDFNWYSVFSPFILPELDDAKAAELYELQKSKGQQ